PSERVASHLAGADAQRLLDAQHPDLAVADRAGAGTVDDRLEHVLDRAALGQDLAPRLGQQLDLVLGAAVDLGVAALAAEAAGVGHGQALDADALPRRLPLFQFERVDDRHDQLHQPRSPWGMRTVAEARSGGAAPAGTGAAAPTPSLKA